MLINSAKLGLETGQCLFLFPMGSGCPCGEEAPPETGWSTIHGHLRTHEQLWTLGDEVQNLQGTAPRSQRHHWIQLPLVARVSLLVTKGIATRSKDATRGATGLTNTSNKKLLGARASLLATKALLVCLGCPAHRRHSTDLCQGPPFHHHRRLCDYGRSQCLRGPGGNENTRRASSKHV